MLVKHVMKSNTVTVDVEDTVVDAAEKISRYGTRWLAVKKGSSIVGVVSERDLVTRVVAKAEPELKNLPVHRIMSEKPVFCRPDDTINEAAERMRENGVEWLLVLDENDEPVGSISLNS